MTTEEQPPTRPSLPTIRSSIEVQQLPSEEKPTEPAEKESEEYSENGESKVEEGENDAPRKQHKRRSGNSVDLSYRYKEPSEDELSWTEDEHGHKKRRKSNKRKSGGGDDFKTGIIPAEGKKKRHRRRSGQEELDEVYSDDESEEESESGDDDKKPKKRRTSGKSDDFKTGIPHVESRRRKKRKSAANEGAKEEEPIETNGKEETPSKAVAPELGDGWTNVEWTILEHTHDHIRNIGEDDPEKVDPTKLAEIFLKLYETHELRLRAEKEGKAMKEFSKEEVRDRIIALRKTRDRRRSGEIPLPAKLGSPASVRSIDSIRRRFSGFLSKLW